MKKFNNINKLISKLFAEYDQQWSGKLYRFGNDGIYYHTSFDGAAFYGENPSTFECPNITNGLYIDVDADHEKIVQLSKNDEDIGIAIEIIAPIFRDKGFDCIVINGETGAEVAGVPIEVILFKKPKQIDTGNISDSDIPSTQG